MIPRDWLARDGVHARLPTVGLVLISLATAAYFTGHRDAWVYFAGAWLGWTFRGEAELAYWGRQLRELRAALAEARDLVRR